MNTRPNALQHLAPAWFSIVMGLCGLGLAWLRAEALMGELTGPIAGLIGVLALAIFGVLAVASIVRLRRHPQAWAADRAHPVRHVFMAAMPAALLLLATLAWSLLKPTREDMPLLRAVVDLAWWAGSIGLWLATLWTLARWWRGNQPGGLVWPIFTPALLIPVVGNVIPPLAGLGLGHGDWAMAQFGLGVLFWPVLLTLMLARVATQGPWPDRLMPSNLILLAPPAVIGLVLLQAGAPIALGWACWGIGLFTLVWVLTQAQRMLAQPFGLPHWGLSFPLAAFTALTLTLARPGGLLAVVGPVLLAATSLLVLGLLLATWRGLRDGTLLAPEPVASLQPVGA
ncbi:SLAC1 anion channel family protein [Sphaerotilus mobilis]|uniref:Tellurite resistance protein n=1 Tax=Sphaerotilus mobilis TaxID=47994 RepID=A0A4Q7LK46_9BURK|nr:SLAC1 anion channel family protein [Sphaerotilus mobilis]RZS54481.1 tellurite resistance protein [Sphaerotilus mobilis]